jgi:hypothetical protein
MFKLFEKESIIAYLIYSILILLLGIKVFSRGVLDTSSEGSYFLTSILNLKDWNHLLLRGLIFLVILFSFFILSLIYANFSYHTKSGLIFQFVICVHFLVASIFPFSLEQVLCVLLFLLMSLLLTRADQKKETVATFYNLGFLFALSILLSISMLFYLIPLLFAIFIYSKNGVRDLLSLILGIASPVCIFFSIIILSDQLSIFHEILTMAKLIHYDLAKKWEWVIAGICLLSMGVTLPSIGSFTIHTRKFYTYLFFCVLTVLPIYIFLSTSEHKMSVMVMLIASFYFLPFLFQMRSYRIKSFLLFFGLIISIFATFVQFK